MRLRLDKLRSATSSLLTRHPLFSSHDALMEITLACFDHTSDSNSSSSRGATGQHQERWAQQEQRGQAVELLEHGFVCFGRWYRCVRVYRVRLWVLSVGASVGAICGRLCGCYVLSRAC